MDTRASHFLAIRHCQYISLQINWLFVDASFRTSMCNIYFRHSNVANINENSWAHKRSVHKDSLLPKILCAHNKFINKNIGLRIKILVAQKITHKQNRAFNIEHTNDIRFHTNFVTYFIARFDQFDLTKSWKKFKEFSSVNTTWFTRFRE